jgi:predicted transcriptional regulator
MSAIETIELLARSEHRVRILDLLCEHGSLEKHALGDRVDASRTTIGRNLGALEEQGWIRRTNGECAITRQGELVAESLGDLVTTMEVTGKLRPFLEWIPDGTLGLDLTTLADAEITLPGDHDPRAMLNRHTRLLGEMDHARGVLPFTSLHSAETVHERVVENGARAEVVVGPAVAKLYRSAAEYVELIEELLATDRFEVFVHDGPLPYGLVVIDGMVQVVAAEDDEPRALLETDADAAREWADETYRRYRRASNEHAIA